jgi:hypothetical protein
MVGQCFHRSRILLDLCCVLQIERIVARNGSREEDGDEVVLMLNFWNSY